MQVTEDTKDNRNHDLCEYEELNFENFLFCVCFTSVVGGKPASEPQEKPAGGECKADIVREGVAALRTIGHVQLGVQPSHSAILEK